jgi:Chitobiase/beta-hexosaminidase C-terminal domain
LPLGVLGDTTTATFYGALHKTLTDILAAEPARVVVLLTPYGNADANAVGNWTTPNGNGVRLSAFQQAVRDVGQLFGVPVVDVGTLSGIGGPTITLFSDDLLHPNATGGARYAQFVYDRLLSLRPLVRAASPVFAPAAGSFTAAQSVTITTATASAAIRYTTDGSVPTLASPLYAAPVSIGGTATLKAIAIKSPLIASKVTSGVYTITTGSPGTGTWTLAPAVLGDLTTTGATVSSLAGGPGGGIGVTKNAGFTYGALWLASGANNAVEFEVANLTGMWLTVGAGTTGWYGFGDLVTATFATGGRFALATGAIVTNPSPGSYTHATNAVGRIYRLARRGNIVELYEWNGSAWTTIIAGLNLAPLAAIAGYYETVKLGVLVATTFTTVRNVKVGTYV